MTSTTTIESVDPLLEALLTNAFPDLEDPAREALVYLIRMIAIGEVQKTARAVREEALEGSARTDSRPFKAG